MKKENQVIESLIKEIYPQYKLQVVSNFIGDEGSSTKSTQAIMLSGFYIHHEIKNAKFVLDELHQQLREVYGTRTKGILNEIQNPFDGVVHYSLRENPEIAIDNILDPLYDNCPIIYDYPANSSVDLQVFDDVKKLVRIYKKANRIMINWTPIITDTKSISDAELIMKSFKGYEDEDIFFVHSLVKGRMTKDGASNVYKAYDNNQLFNEMREKGKLCTIRIDTVLNNDASEVISKYTQKQIAKFIADRDVGVLKGYAGTLLDMLHEDFYDDIKEMSFNSHGNIIKPYDF